MDTNVLNNLEDKINIEWVMYAHTILCFLILPISTGVIHTVVWPIFVLFNGFLMILSLNKKAQNSSGRLMLDPLDVSIVLFLIWQIFIFILHRKGFSYLVRSFAFLSTLYIYKTLSISKKNITLIGYIHLGFIVSWLLYFIFNYKVTKFQAYFGNPNYLGLMIINSIVVLTIVTYRIKAVKFCAIFIAFALLLFTSGRTAYLQLAIMLGLGTYIFAYRKYIRNNKLSKQLTIFFALILFVIFMITIFYPILGQSPYANDLNSWSFNLFGKRFFTGRETIWASLLNEFGKHPIVGYGLGTDFHDFDDSIKSAHNLYISLLLQGGILNLLLLLNILYQIFRELVKHEDVLSTVACILLFGILLRETFEITLTHNLLTLGIFYWSFTGISLNSSQNALKSELINPFDSLHNSVFTFLKRLNTSINYK